MIDSTVDTLTEPISTFALTGDGQLHSVTETKGENVTVYVYQYDTLGNLVGSEKLEDNTSVLRTWHSYDTDNRLSSQGWQIGADSDILLQPMNNIPPAGILEFLPGGNLYFSFQYIRITLPGLDLCFTWPISIRSITSSRISGVNS